MTGATNAYWLEQIEADLPVGNEWLSTGEISFLSGLRFAKRRADWRLGRWTAKRAVASYLNLPADVDSLQDIEVRAASTGAPDVFLFNHRASINLSLSHRAGKALCVVGLPGAGLGCDLELVESRGPAFVTDFFTAIEQKLLECAPADERLMLATLLWSAKESALKALHVGLRFDTAALDVNPAPGTPENADHTHPDGCIGWSPLSLRRIGDLVLHGWWRCANNMVRTVVFSPLP